MFIDLKEEDQVFDPKNMVVTNEMRQAVVGQGPVYVTALAGALAGLITNRTMLSVTKAVSAFREQTGQNLFVVEERHDMKFLTVYGAFTKDLIPLLDNFNPYMKYTKKEGYFDPSFPMDDIHTKAWGFKPEDQFEIFSGLTTPGIINLHELEISSPRPFKERYVVRTFFAKDSDGEVVTGFKLQRNFITMNYFTPCSNLPCNQGQT